MLRVSTCITPDQSSVFRDLSEGSWRQVLKHIVRPGSLLERDRRQGTDTESRLIWRIPPMSNCFGGLVCGDLFRCVCTCLFLSSRLVVLAASLALGPIIVLGYSFIPVAFFRVAGGREGRREGGREKGGEGGWVGGWVGGWGICSSPLVIRWRAPVPTLVRAFARCLLLVSCQFVIVILPFPAPR